MKCKVDVEFSCGHILPVEAEAKGIKDGEHLRVRGKCPICKSNSQGEKGGTQKDLTEKTCDSRSKPPVENEAHCATTPPRNPGSLKK